MRQIELIDKRKKREKHFLKEDGEFIAEMYKEDIHYLENGKYEEIDNTLILKDNYYVNKNNNYNVSFTSKVSKNIMKIEKDNHYLNINLNKYDNYTILKSNTKSKIASEIKYFDVLKNVDISYNILSSKVKENIFINDIDSEINQLSFNIETNLDLKINLDNSLSALFNNEEIFKIDSPFMMDALGNVNKNISYNLIKENNKYQLFMTLDDEWLKNAEYPVLIDPTIVNSSDENNVYDTYIYPGDTNVDKNSLGILKAGVERINNVDIINRTLLKFNLPIIGTGSQVVNAKLNLTSYPDLTQSYEDNIVNIHKVTQDWNEESAFWNTMNDKYDSRVEGAFNCTRIYYTDENGYIDHLSNNEADITTLVQKWYTGTKNNGIMLKASEEVYKSDVIPVFYSKNNPESSEHIIKPLLVITYRNQNGLEKYMNYESHSFTKGASYHNTYNGNLTTVFDIGSTKTGKMPVNLKLVYNTNDVVLQKNIGYGMGYKLNFNQTINEETIDDKVYLKYVDEDGTIHYFLNQKVKLGLNDNKPISTDNIYYDEDGLDLQIEKLDSKYILKDKNNNQMTFEKYNNIGYLTEIKDVSGNVNTIYYDISYSKITGIKDANNQWIDIIYDTNNIISIISPDQTVTLSFLDSNILGSIIDKTGTIYIDYNQYNLIIGITDITGKKVQYEYYSEIPYKLKKVIEYGLNNTIGNYYNVEYGFNVTSITDSKNKTKTITFNNFGNPSSISNLKSSNDITNAYGSKITFGESLFGDNTYKNKLLSNTIPIKYVKNLLSDTSFEGGTINFSSNENTSLSITDECACIGFKSLKYTSFNADCSISKIVNVTKGKYYTFSAYVKTSDIPVKLSIGYNDVNNNLIEENSESITTDGNFERLDVTIFYPEDVTSDLILKVCMNNIGICYIDDIQLEEGEVVNNYNLIENSDFSNGLDDWILYSNDEYPVSSVFSVVDIDEGKALKINMNTSNTTSVQKTFKICGKKYDHYTLSFWYKNEGINGAEDGIAGEIKNNVSIMFYPEDESIAGDSLIDDFTLNPNENEWQFFSRDFYAEYDFKEFDLLFYQSMNGNNFYITNINLFKDVRSVTYNYDDNGNLISSKNLNDKTDEFNYDKNNQLIKMMDPKGANFHYEYDNVVTDRVLRGVSETGISNEIEYDSFGNPIISRIISRGQMMTPINGKYKIRLKGTNKILKLINNTVILIDDLHGHDKWNIEKVTIDEIDYYKIYHSIINNKYLTDYNNCIISSEYKNDYSLFELIKQDNGSFYIKNKLNDKYLKNDNNSLIFTNLIENDENFEFYFESITNSDFIECSAEYTQDGKFITKTIDTNFNEINYDIDTTTGLIKSITNPKNQTTYYNYDDLDRLISIVNNDKEVSYEYNNNNILTKITQDDRDYNFDYNEFLNIKSIKIGDAITLVTNNYEDNNGNLISTTYGNGQTIDYEYDDFNRISKITKQNDTYNYKYNNNGDLVKILSNNDTIKYTYDLAKRLYEYKFNDFKIRYGYDENDNVISKKYQLDDINHVINNTLNKDDSIIKTTIDNNEINYNYDSLGRLINSNINDNYQTNYEYITNGNRTSMVVKSISNNNDKYSYKYDKLGNIIRVYHNEELENEYYYDDYNQLIREDNYILNKTIRYTYDSLGNILYKKEYELNTYSQLKQIKYEYNNQNWKDQLTKYNNQIITYDNLGNPISIGDNISLNWINGRQLNSYTDQNNTINYKYNVNGIRTSKIINNIETKYYLDGSKIILEKTGNNMIYYMRSNNELIGFKYNDDIYYYIKNNQNDIIGILDSNYNVVARYTYDSWGNIITITDINNNDISNNLTHIANINPYRYRSYYYDKETKLYYLNSRYYNPLWGRFINADNYISTDSGPLGHNMYLYCNNNYINYIDYDGHAIITGLVIGITIVGVAVLVNTISRMKNTKKEIQKVQSKKNIPDKTKEMDEELQKNAKKMQNYIYQNQSANVKLENFINNVKENGPMDLKNREEFSETISYNGIVMEPQDIGNFNFGYIGRAYGYPTEFLADGAGVYQLSRHYKNPETYLNCFSISLCDDPRDSYFIRMGAIKYDEEYKRK